jgi:hypothetical protein
MLDGGAGDDQLDGGEGDDMLSGGTGADILQGGKGRDTLQGGAGDDVLDTGTGHDTIRFGRGDGRDRLVGREHNQGDTVEFGAGIRADHLWFTREGDDLAVSVLSGRPSADRLTIEDWYTDKHHRVGEFRTADGLELDARHVERLRQAMAGFEAPELSGDMTLPPDIESALAPVLAAAWDRPGC